MFPQFNEVEGLLLHPNVSLCLKMQELDHVSMSHQSRTQEIKHNGQKFDQRENIEIFIACLSILRIYEKAKPFFL